MNNIELNYIVLLVCRKYYLSENIIFSISRKQNIKDVRFIFFYLAINTQDYSWGKKKYTLKEIQNYVYYKSGNYFTHATLLNAKNKVKNRMDIYTDFKKEIESLLEEIRLQNFPTKDRLSEEVKPINIVVKDVDLLKMAQINKINSLI